MDNFDFHMFGYFLKLLWLHYQPEIPSWVLDMHLMYVKDKEPGNAKTREKRARMYSPEGLCMQLENVNLPFGDYAPSAFGKIIEDQFNECFGKDLLNGKATLVFKSAENAKIMLFKSLLHGSVHPAKHSAVSPPIQQAGAKRIPIGSQAQGASSARKSDKYRPSERSGRVKKSTGTNEDPDEDGEVYIVNQITIISITLMKSLLCCTKISCTVNLFPLI
jgi:hypothetical protein